MKEGVVYRQGRTRLVSENEKKFNNACFENYLCPAFAVFIILSLSIKLYTSEIFFVNQQIAFEEIEDEIIPLNLPYGELNLQIANGRAVHFLSSYQSTVTDNEFGLTFQHALKLQRATEYCQWQELSRKHCEKCTETVKGKKKTYDCNCKITYSYIKRWRNHRINSFHFDQPANHYNPQRDPFPSRNFFSYDLTNGDLYVSNEIVKNLRAPVRPVVFTYNKRPIQRNFADKLFNLDFIVGPPPETRFEDVKQGLFRFKNSRAGSVEKFIYTNTPKGWFFSPYKATTWEKLFQGFGQYLEGSLFDWQIGDFYDMVNGCTAGDVRVRYFLADPRSISVIGQFIRDEETEEISIKPYVVAKNEFSIGLIHAGEHGSDKMLTNETHEAYFACKVWRFSIFFVGLAFTYLLNHFGRLSMAFSAINYFLISTGFSLCFIAFTWILVYGFFHLWTVIFLVIGIVLIIYFHYADSNKYHKRL